MTVFDRALETARARQARVVMPELAEPRLAQAATALKDRGLCTCLSVTEAPTDAQMSALVDGRGIKEGVARRMLARPLYRAAAMVACGEADVMVAGIEAPTKRVIEAAVLSIGLADGNATPSSFFLMVLPDGREILFADCAVVVAPQADELAGIATATAASAKALLGEARVALLSYSTGTSGAGASVDLVADVARRTGFPGPIQADAALNAAIAEKKGIGGAGDANVLIFPDLNAGNIAYKLVQELARAQAVGPLLQGFRRPVCDLSRGASPDDVVAATVLTIALSA